VQHAANSHVQIDIDVCPGNTYEQRPDDVHVVGTTPHQPEHTRSLAVGRAISRTADSTASSATLPSYDAPHTPPQSRSPLPQYPRPAAPASGAVGTGHAHTRDERLCHCA
jgi:hypothetical protein